MQIKGNGRERMFFGISDMSTWNFVGTNILNILYLLQDKKDIHGRGLQQLMLNIFDGTWIPGNDITYRILNTYESEKYVVSHWNESTDSNKRYIRYYKITDQGKEYLTSLKQSFHDTLVLMGKTFEEALILIWCNLDLQKEPSSYKQISSSAFTMINVLNFLYRKKYGITSGSLCESINRSQNNVSGAPWAYGKEVKDTLGKIYSGIWQPSDGVLYPLLSKLDINKYLNSRWTDNNEESFNKKRTVREYIITDKGEHLLKELVSSESGLKNKIFQLKTLCSKSIEIIYGNSSANTSRILHLLTDIQ